MVCVVAVVSVVAMMSAVAVELSEMGDHLSDISQEFKNSEFLRLLLSRHLEGDGIRIPVQAGYFTAEREQDGFKIFGRRGRFWQFSKNFDEFHFAPLFGSVSLDPSFF